MVSENLQGASARDRIVTGIEAVNKQKALHLQELRETAKSQCLQGSKQGLTDELCAGLPRIDDTTDRLEAHIVEG